MRIVVVGASGNVGTAVVTALRAADHDVAGVSRRPVRPFQPYAGLDWFQTDIADPGAESTLARAFAGADAVVHLAWGFQPARDRDYLRRVGVDGTRAVLRAAAAAGVAHLVHMSSVGAYSAAPRGVRQDESYPVNGIASSAYSVDKAAAERVLDEHEASGQGPAVCRLRPGLILQRAAGSSLLRYSLPAALPSAVINLVVVLPWDRSFAVPIVHTRDVAAAVAAAVREHATGAFNLAADEPLTAGGLAQALGARLLPVPWRAIRTVVAGAYAARLSRLDPGWIDLAFAVPLLDTARARRELGWAPTVATADVIGEAIQGMRNSRSGSSEPLRPRSVVAELQDLLAAGPISHRRRA